MWGATNTAQLAARLVAIEEEGLDLPTPTWDGGLSSHDPPVSDARLPQESERIQSFEIMKYLETGAYQVRIIRFRHVDGRISRVLQDYTI